MTQTEELATQVPTHGRRIKFTPKRIQQIRNLVEQGKSRDEIAELIGVTVRSLQVTCSRLAISVRRLDSSHLPSGGGVKGVCTGPDFASVGGSTPQRSAGSDT
jgi:hypothetical protein